MKNKMIQCYFCKIISLLHYFDKLIVVHIEIYNRIYIRKKYFLNRLMYLFTDLFVYLFSRCLAGELESYHLKSGIIKKKCYN